MVRKGYFSQDFSFDITCGLSPEGFKRASQEKVLWGEGGYSTYKA
jgi:hypothetical protein